jgi:hypothetical protein
MLKIELNKVAGKKEAVTVIFYTAGGAYSCYSVLAISVRAYMYTPLTVN